MTENKGRLLDGLVHDALTSTDVICKLQNLLHCGNDRIELAAAKELLSVFENETRQKNQSQDVRLEVDIRIIEPKEHTHENHTS